jgi:hypothetical protein
MPKIATATSSKEPIEVWQQHCYFEFAKKGAEAALGTISDDPHVLMVPLAIGGRGRDGVYNFYHDYFLAQLPADMAAVPISQVVGENILAEEAVYQFTHDQVMDWFLPGVRPLANASKRAWLASLPLKTAKSLPSICTGIMPACWLSWVSSIPQNSQ